MMHSKGGGNSIILDCAVSLCLLAEAAPPLIGKILPNLARPSCIDTYNSLRMVQISTIGSWFDPTSELLNKSGGLSVKLNCSFGLWQCKLSGNHFILCHVKDVRESYRPNIVARDLMPLLGVWYLSCSIRFCLLNMAVSAGFKSTPIGNLVSVSNGTFDGIQLHHLIVSFLSLNQSMWILVHSFHSAIATPLLAP